MNLTGVVDAWISCEAIIRIKQRLNYSLFKEELFNPIRSLIWKQRDTHSNILMRQQRVRETKLITTEEQK